MEKVLNIFISEGNGHPPVMVGVFLYSQNGDDSEFLFRDTRAYRLKATKNTLQLSNA